MGKPLKDLTGKVYSKVTVVSRAPDKRYSNGRVKVLWNCTCTCGVVFITAGDYLKRGDTTSCGCHRLKVLKSKKDLLIASHKLTYNSWRGMKQRFSNHSRYTKLGISDSWLGAKGFATFLSDVGERPDSTYTLDRKDTNKGYYKGNCRWVSKGVQAFNKVSSGKSGVLGVAPLRGKWQANITYKGKTEYLGVFKDKQEAMKVRREAELRLYGEYSSK